MDKVIFAAPVVRLAAELRGEAARCRARWKDEVRAAVLEDAAERIEEALQKGAEEEWVPVDAAADLLKRHPETIRQQCRKVYGPAGRAKKMGGVWRIHLSAVVDEIAA